MNHENIYIYGRCELCGGKLMPNWYIAEEEVHGIKTGRVKNAVGNLYCQSCGEVVTVDDSFDGKWQYRRF